jgi:hypothetical protein
MGPSNDRARRLVGLVAVAVAAAGAQSADAAVVQAPGSPFPAASQPFWIASGDLDRNGTADLAVADVGSDAVGVLLGDGRGGFTAAAGSPFSAATGGGSSSVALGDFDRDGRVDLAVSELGADSVAILAGDGRGGFTPAASTPVGGVAPTSVAVADFDRDGELDLATSNSGSNDVSVLLGHGPLRFRPAQGSPFAAGPAGNPRSVVAGDLNQDGRRDITFVDNNGAGDVVVLLGDGHGRFAPAPGSPFASGGENPIQAVVGDFDRRRGPDVAVANTNSSNVSLLLNTGGGSLVAAPGSPFSTGADSFPFSLAAADFDRTGTLDVVTANFLQATATVLLGDGGGALAPAPGSPFSLAPAGLPISVTTADFDRDGRPDIATANLATRDVTVLLNQR